MTDRNTAGVGPSGSGGAHLRWVSGCASLSARFPSLPGQVSVDVLPLHTPTVPVNAVSPVQRCLRAQIQVRSAQGQHRLPGLCPWHSLRTAHSVRHAESKCIARFIGTREESTPSVMHLMCLLWIFVIYTAPEEGGLEGGQRAWL
jgi:hypothetical protein